METNNNSQSNITNIRVDNEKQTITITTANGEEGINVSGIQGGCMVIIMGGAVSKSDGADPAPEPQPTPEPAPAAKTPGKVISFTLKIKNNRANPVTIDDKVNFVLANPDKNGFYYGATKEGTAYKGWYNRWKMPLVGNNQKITIPAGSEKSFTLKPSDTSTIFNADGTLYGSNVTNGFGGRNLVSKDQVYNNNWSKDYGKTNVLLYVDGNSAEIVPDFMDPSVVFEQGKTYTAIIK